MKILIKKLYQNLYLVYYNLIQKNLGKDNFWKLKTIDKRNKKKYIKLSRYNFVNWNIIKWSLNFYTNTVYVLIKNFLIF